MPSMVVCRRLRRFSERRASALSACTSACEARSAASAAPRTLCSAWALRSKPVRLTDTDVIASFVVLLMASNTCLQALTALLLAPRPGAQRRRLVQRDVQRSLCRLKGIVLALSYKISVRPCGRSQ